MTVLRVDTIAASGQTSENTGSVFFDGSGDYLNIPNNTQFEVGEDFTFETWIYRTSLGSLNTIYSYLTAGTTLYGLSFILTTTGIGIYGYNNGSSSYDALLTISGVVTANEWHHVAVVRSSNTWYYYIDGVLQGSGTMTSFSYSGTPTFYIGYQNDNYANSFAGYLSNYRILKGTALYTSNFTPPTRELEVTPETVLLCCYDGENIFAEKTGKIIAAYGDRSSGIHTVGESPIGITTFQPGLTRSVDVTAGPVLQGNLEYNSQNFLVLPKGTTEEQFVNIASNANPAPRGLRAGGQTPGTDATIDFVTITTNGTAQTFGDLSVTRFGAGGIGSPTRGLFCGGGTPVRQTVIDFVTIATTGDAQTFGDLIGDARTIAGSSCGNTITGLTFGGATSSSTVNSINYITIATTGNARDFGDCTKQNGSAAISSPTRAVSAGGDTNADGSHINSIEYVTIQSTGNAFDFGDLLSAGTGRGVANSTRGIFSIETPSAAKTLQYLNIASTGSTVAFGDLISDNLGGGGATYSSLIRGCFAGIRTPAITSTIEFAVIPTLGDVQDFGDLSEPVTNGGGLSNGHGGLG